MTERLGESAAREALNSRWARYALGPLAVAASAAGMITGYWHNTQQDSGQHELIKPRVTGPYTIGRTLRIGEWNIESEDENNFRLLKVLARRNSFNVMELQEVSSSAEEKIVKEFPDWSAIFAVGDTTIKNGKFGNMLMVRNQVPTDITSRSIDGTSLLDSLMNMGAGIFQDAAIDTWHSLNSSIANPITIDTSINNTKNGLQETRAIVGATIKERVGDQVLSERIITTHISGNPAVSSKQLQAVEGYVEDNTEPYQLTEVCADFNTKPEQKIAKEFESINYVTPQKTGLHHNQNGDYCVYNGWGTAHTRTLSLPGKHEHIPLLFTVTLPELPTVTSNIPSEPGRSSAVTR